MMMEYFKSSIPFFHPYGHVPLTNQTNDINIYPVEGCTLVVFKSMQNVQVLTGTGGCYKYVCKYITKNNEQSYVVVVDGSGKLVKKLTFFHNKKVMSLKIGQYKDRKNIKIVLKEDV